MEFGTDDGIMEAPDWVVIDLLRFSSVNSRCAGWFPDFAVVPRTWVDRRGRWRTTKQMKASSAPPPPRGPLASTDPLTVVKAGPLPPSDAVTWLKVVGGSLWLPLDRTRFAFSLGSGEPSQVDLPLQLQYVSRLHCKMERDGNWLVVSNHSRNGTMFAGRREERAPVKAGDCFTVGATELLALDDHLYGLHAALQRALGFGAHASVDRALIDVARREQPPLLLTGPAGSEPDRLAAAIHRGSPRRGLSLVTLDASAPRAAIRSAAASAGAGSVFVDLRAMRGKRMSAGLVEALFAESSRARPLIAAPTLEAALGMFDVRARRMEEICVPAIQERAHEIPALLDALLEELGSARRFYELPIDRQEAACRFDWPENHLDLRRSAPRIAAYLDAGGNVSGAARVLGVDDSTLGEALERVGIIERRRRQPARKST